MTRIRRLANAARVALEAGRQRRVPFWSPARIERAQRRRLTRIVRHAWDTVPFWREAMEERGLTPRDLPSVDDLKRLPLIDGALFHARKADFGSTAVVDRDVLSLSTSASSRGIPKVVRWDPESQLLKLAYAERDRMVLTRLAGKAWGQRQMWILPAVSSAYVVRQWWDAQVLMPRGFAHREIFPPESPFEEWVERLDRFRPLVVYSYGSSSERFFRWLTITGRSAWLPRVWVFGGERMAPEWRARAEELGCRVLSTYQSVEAGRIGFECELRDGFHLNVDLCPVRIVDDDGRDVPAGAVGEVVVSNLFNRATVLFNMRTGDRAALEPHPCPCGRTLPLLSQLEGRTWETIRLPGGEEIGSTDLFNALKDEVAFALQFQLVHPAPGRVAWRVVVDPAQDAGAGSRRLAARTLEVLGPGSSVTVERVEEILPEPSGKWRLVVRGWE
jgi:phenylacetate-CoA ligase